MIVDIGTKNEGDNVGILTDEETGRRWIIWGDDVFGSAETQVRGSRWKDYRLRTDGKTYMIRSYRWRQGYPAKFDWVELKPVQIIGIDWAAPASPGRAIKTAIRNDLITGKIPIRFSHENAAPPEVDKPFDLATSVAYDIRQMSDSEYLELFEEPFEIPAGSVPLIVVMDERSAPFGVSFKEGRQDHVAVFDAIRFAAIRKEEGWT